jgi:uncharacterized membrane protein YqjE
MFSRLEEIKDSLYKYLETKLELFKIELQSSLERVVVQLVYLVILIVLVFVSSIFLLIMLAVFLNHWLHSNYAGFAIVSAFVATLTLLWVLAGSAVQAVIRRLLHWIFTQK